MPVQVSGAWIFQTSTRMQAYRNICLWFGSFAKRVQVYRDEHTNVMLMFVCVPYSVSIVVCVASYVRTRLQMLNCSSKYSKANLLKTKLEIHGRKMASFQAGFLGGWLEV